MTIALGMTIAGDNASATWGHAVGRSEPPPNRRKQVEYETGERAMRSGWWLAVVVLCTGCGGSIPSTRHYMIQLPAAAPLPREPVPYTAAVMPLRAPGQLEQDRILFRPSPVEVGYYEYHRWAERPASIVTSLLVERLRGQRFFAGVLLFDGRTKADYLIRGRLERLEEIDSPGAVAVRVELTAEAVEVKTNRVVWSGTASHNGPVSQGDVKAVVEEISRGVEACLGQLMTGLEAFVKSLPAAPVASSAVSR